MAQTTTLGEICEKPQYGYTAKARRGDGVRFLRITDFSTKELDWGTVPSCDIAPPDFEKYKLASKDILFARSGSIGEACLISECPDAVFASYLIRFRPKGDTDPEYVYLWTKSPNYWVQIEEQAHGLGMNNINAKQLAALEIPVPPIDEQKRIVGVLKAALGEIREAREALARLPGNVRRFRQAVLAAAFRGELTEDWRKENPLPPSAECAHGVRYVDSPATWAEASAEELAAQEAYAISIGPFGSNLKVSDYQPIGVPLVFVKNIRTGVFAGENAKFISSDKATELRAHQTRAGDILITKMGDPPGDACVLPEGFDLAVITSDCIKWTVDAQVGDRNFLANAVASPPIREQVAELTSGVAQQKISLAKFRTIIFPVPPLAEQGEIVRRIEAVFAEADAAEAAATAAYDSLRSLEQSTLQSAFRGEI